MSNAIVETRSDDVANGTAARRILTLTTNW